MLRDAGIACTIEPRATMEAFGNGGPDILAHGFPQNDVTTSIEVAVVNPMQQSMAQNAARFPLHAASCRTAAKLHKYEAATAANHLNNYTAVVEVTGALSSQFTNIIKDCARKATKRPEAAIQRVKSYWSTNTSARYWRQRIAVKLHRESYEMAAFHGLTYHATRMRGTTQRSYQQPQPTYQQPQLSAHNNKRAGTKGQERQLGPQRSAVTSSSSSSSSNNNSSTSNSNRNRKRIHKRGGRRGNGRGRGESKKKSCPRQWTDKEGVIFVEYRQGKVQGDLEQRGKLPQIARPPPGLLPPTPPGLLPPTVEEISLAGSSSTISPQKLHRQASRVDLDKEVRGEDQPEGQEEVSMSM